LRLFFAVTLSEDVCNSLLALQAKLQDRAGREGIKWESADHFHFTLKFLGSAAPESLECIKRVGREAAAQCAPFEIALEGVGAFPDIRRPKILWAGVSRGIPELTRLAEYLDGGLAACGFAKETHRFTPHLTLARIKSPTGEKSAAKMLTLQAKESKKVDKEGVFLARNVVLIQSELTPQGSVYTVLNTFAFAANELD
jgi:2'-5' RNA ligase